MFPGELVQVAGSLPARPGWQETRTAVAAWDVRWWGGSLPGRPWEARPRWTITGTLTTVYPASVTVGLDGTTTVTTSTVETPVTAVCTGTITIEQKRARNSL